MYVNMSSPTEGDLIRVGRTRDWAAKQAGQALYPGGSIPEQTSGWPEISGTYSNSSLMDESRGKMSAVRRTFCLFVAFDLILTFILWVIYTQLIGDKGWVAFQKQVAGYNFTISLFDTVMLSAVRLTFLLLAYALFNLKHWWMVAVTTFLSCAFLVAKIFLFDFGSTQSSKNPLSYCLLIISFVLAWVETWFLDFKVLPQETKDREKRERASRGYIDERTPLLRDNDDRSVDDSRYYSPVESLDGSDEETDKQARDRFYSVPATGQSNKQEVDYLSIGLSAWNNMWDMITSDDSEWKKEAGTDPTGGCVHSRTVPTHGKVFRLQGLVELSPADLFREIVTNQSEQPDWNPTVIECRTLQVINDNTDVSYNVAAEGGGGLITSRDFVTVRHWGVKDGTYMSAGIATTHPEMPPQKKYVRGENGPGGWGFKPVPGEPDQCIFVWLLNTNLKGWLPQKLIDQSLSTVCLDMLAHVRKRAESLNNTER
ncbi:stAR-related lipid transfer protein 3-like isoform X2 [Haliotis rubra]|uniref:stAR-related lipid transfer protein 3-like isoform X2 n=2 Tax=Haliotis rubra TaxID=36100 RepID=UPI001EE61CF9|nr:stAR-related lipid transfer protein 3-like isoform X2 [Haliotis rubra]